MKPNTFKALAVIAVLVFCAVFASSASATPPAIESESVSGISSTSATLKAVINPQSTERGAYYQFQLAEDPSEFASEFTCPTEGFPANSSLCLGITAQEGALPIRGIPAGTSGQAVSLDLESVGVTLEPGTTYYYRVISARIVPSEDTTQWEEPTVFGPDQTFAASDSNSAPAIEAQSLANLTSTDATLKATINPGGLETTYEFLLWESPCGPECELIINVPLPSATLPASSVGQEVSLDLNSAGVTLTPGAEYGYSVTASNSEGSDEGTWKIFYAPGEGSGMPAIEGESVSHLSATNATLEAGIEPAKASGGTYYQFQLVEDPSEFAEEIQCPPPPSSGPFIACNGNESATALPIGHVGPSNFSVLITLNLSEAGVVLKPGTTYHYRVLAATGVSNEDTIEWAEPTVFGADQSFTTPAPPVISNESATNITSNDATLNAEIDPLGKETTYRFQIDTTGHFKFDQEDSCVLHPPEAVCAQEVIAGEPLPAGLVEPPEQTLPAVEGPQKVSVDLNLIGAMLQPSTIYYFRVVATHDGSEIVEGPSRTFTTCAFGEPCPAAGGPSAGTESPGSIQAPIHVCPRHKIKRHGKCIRKPRCGRKHHSRLHKRHRRRCTRK